jgi:hypothetical protein
VSRFNRNYQLIIEVEGGLVDIRPSLGIAFSITKSIYGGLNKANIKVTNLNESNRLKLVKDVEDNINIPFQLYVGYGTDLDLLFKGTMHKGSSSRSGVDFVTSIESLDGGFDFLNSFTSKTVKNKDAAIDGILGDMPNTVKGFITPQNKVTRPIVMVGNSVKMIEKHINSEETYYIDDGKLYIINKTDITGDFIPVVSAETGLLNTPSRQNKRVSFSTLLNPSIKIGGRVKLVSVTAPHLDGIYKVEDCIYAGDYYGQDWNQDITGTLYNV